MNSIKDSFRVDLAYGQKRYYPNSKNSEHITKLIEDQHDKGSRNKCYHRPNINFDKNQSLPSSSRGLIS